MLRALCLLLIQNNVFARLMVHCHYYLLADLKINNKTITYNEILQIADIIGHTIKWNQKKD